MFKIIKKELLSISLIILTLLFSTPLYANNGASSSELSDVQRNSVTMLNYLSALTEEINSSKNSRMFLEEAYSLLINNTHPSSVDYETQYQLNLLLDILESYRLVNVKRERLQYMFEMNQAKAIRSAIPNPLGLLSMVQSASPTKIVASLVFMAIDSYSSYTSTKSEIEMQYLKEGWELDDKESEILHDVRKGLFNYMVNIVRSYDLPGELALNEKSINEFIAWKYNENVAQRIQFFVAHEKEYQLFGPYWLALAEAYYTNGEYKKCIEAIEQYEKIQTKIFRKDYDLAKTLTMAIISAREIYDDASYTNVADRYSQVIIENSDNDDWVIRYFVAQTYIELAGISDSLQERVKYLNLAYNIALNNVNSLVANQKMLNLDFINPLENIPVKGSSKEKSNIKKYNKDLKNQRKTELAPVYEPLMLNIDLLYSLADEIQISDQERLRIREILNDNGSGIYLIEPLNAHYNLSQSASDDIDVELTKSSLTVPLKYVYGNSKIQTTLTTANETVIVDDWVIDSVTRGDESDLETFRVKYKSESLGKQQYDATATAVVNIWPVEESQQTLTFKFEVEKYRANWIFKDTVVFGRVL